MDTLPQDVALVIVDVQDGLDDPSLGRRSNPHAERNIERLLSAWRRSGRPVFHIQHLSRRATSPLRPGQPGVEIKQAVRPISGEPVIPKHGNSAFVGTDLAQRLQRADVTTLVVVGLTTDHCVSSTVRTASDLGFKLVLVGDATAAFDTEGPDGRLHSAEEVHAISLATLHGMFATVVETEEMLRRL